jgi:hypothetical protein
LKRLKESDIRNCFAGDHTPCVNLIFEIFTVLREWLPEYEEQLRWKRLVLYKPNPRTTVKDSICMLRPVRKYVELAIPLGVLFENPENVMEGTQRYKRIIKIRSFEDFDREAVKNVLLQSYHFDGDQVLYKLLPNTDYRELRTYI